ncbi:MAG: hypothetical protein LBH81_03895 [Rickettsiales bacterium]|jgi:hypothetical protein|nr:hypothetical protein [Rickettsiales bacterium]
MFRISFSYLSILFLLAACGGNFDSRNEKYMDAFKKGDYESAAQFLPIKDEELANETWLAGLQCGAGYMWAGREEKAQQCFAAADDALGESKSTTYDPLEFEKIMMKTYQGMSALTMHDPAARRFFNQAYYLQTQSVQAASKQIDELEQEFKKSAAKVPGMPSLSSIVKDVDSQMERNAQVAAMSDFANPYATWLSALHSGLNGDIGNAENYIKRVMVFAPENKFVAGDIAALKSGQPHVWIVLEDGIVGRRTIHKMAPRSLRKWNINLSIPDLTAGTRAVRNLEIADGNKKVETQLLADITRIAKTDLMKTRRRDIIASVSFEVAKVAAAGTAFVVSEVAAHSHAGKNDAGGAMAFALLGRAAFAVLMARDLDWETRNWGALPNTVAVARVPMPRSREIEIDGVGKVRIPAGINNAIVSVRIPLQTAKPGIIIGKLN